MNYSSEVYQLIHLPGEHKDFFEFISIGENKIVKSIEYTELIGFRIIGAHPLYNKQIFNLGFGNFISIDRDIDDGVLSNNGDVFKVFNTVLITVPLFFQNHKDAAIMVMGSDSGPEFVNSCRKSCKRFCNNECKKKDRRINIYKKYIEKHFGVLCLDYDFFGAVKNDSGFTLYSDYEIKNSYNCIFIIKK